MANADLWQDFDKCTTLFKDFLAQDKINGVDPQVGAVGTGNGGPNLSYIPKDQWLKLSREERDEIDAGRKAQKASRGKGGKNDGGGGGGGGGGKYKGKKATWKKGGVAKLINKAVDRKIKALSKKLAEDENDSNVDDPMKDEKDMHKMHGSPAKKKSGN